MYDCGQQLYNSKWQSQYEHGPRPARPAAACMGVRFISVPLEPGPGWEAGLGKGGIGKSPRGKGWLAFPTRCSWAFLDARAFQMVSAGDVVTKVTAPATLDLGEGAEWRAVGVEVH